MFLTFSLGNLLRATTACTFSTSRLPKVVRSWGVLYILNLKCASRHNGVQFFSSHLASWLRTCRFSEPTFRPSGAPNHWKNTVFRDFPTFSRICIFFLLTLSLVLFFLLIFLFSLPLPCSAFHLSILSEVWLLNFLRPINFKQLDFLISGQISLHQSFLGLAMIRWFFSQFEQYVRDASSRFPLQEFMIQQGGVSKATKTVNLSEDGRLRAMTRSENGWNDAYFHIFSRTLREGDGEGEGCIFKE